MNQHFHLPARPARSLPWAAVLLSSCLLLLGLACPAQAASPKEKQATRLFLQGKYQEALDIYVDLAVSTSNPIWKCEIARCQRRLGNVRDARFNVSECLASAKLSPARRQGFEQLQAEIDAEIAGVPLGGAAPAAATPPAPGPNTGGSAAGPGQPTAIEPATPGQIGQPASGQPYPGQPPGWPGPPQGAPAGAGAPAGNATPYPPPPGDSMGQQPPNTNLYAAPAASGDSEKGWMRPAAYVAGAVGITAAAGGALAGYYSQKKFDEVETQYNDARHDNAKKLNTFQFVGYGVGAVGLGAAVVLFLLEPDGEPSEGYAKGGLRLAPMGPAGLVVAGRF